MTVKGTSPSLSESGLKKHKQSLSGLATSLAQNTSSKSCLTHSQRLELNKFVHFYTESDLE